jgi:hypothetical protein
VKISKGIVQFTGMALNATRHAPPGRVMRAHSELDAAIPGIVGAYKAENVVPLPTFANADNATRILNLRINNMEARTILDPFTKPSTDAARGRNVFENRLLATTGTQNRHQLAGQGVARAHEVDQVEMKPKLQLSRDL